MKYSVSYVDLGIRDYKETWDLQTERFNALIRRKVECNGVARRGSENPSGTLFFVEHPSVYTLGKSGRESNLLIDRIKLQSIETDFYRTNRGGDITYHGPGQIVGYPILDLEEIGIGLRDYVYRIEEAIILSMNELGITCERYDGATGVWLDSAFPERARKICAIGVRSSRFVTMHGFALNVNTDLSFYNYINPCGFIDKGITSVSKELGELQNMEKIKRIVRRNLGKVLNLNLKTN